MLRVVDSVAELVPGGQDAGCVAVTGSHGGLSAARYALAARPLISVFNDAGVGKDQAGISSLDFLQGHGLAACTVAHVSARIGEARSTLADGIISYLNPLAGQMGLQTGVPLREALAALFGNLSPRLE
jgi:hypothetical protein